MKISDIECLPFGEIANALAATPHARRMAGHLMTVCPKVQGGDKIARACMSPEFAAASAWSGNEDVVTSLIAAKALPDAREAKYCKIAFRLAVDEVVTQRYSNALFVLGNVGGAVLRKAVRCENHDAKSALWGNPLVHGDNGKPNFQSLADDGAEWFFRNAATFGNLGNHFIEKLLVDTLLSANDECTFLQECLYTRDDVPESLVMALADSSKPSLDGWLALMKMPGHQKLVKAGKATGVVRYGDRLVVSPVAELPRVFDCAETQKSIVLCAQCPEDAYFDVLRNCPEYLKTFDFLNESPWAKAHLSKITDTWGAVRAILHEQIDKQHGLQTLAVDAMPFDLITPDNLRECFTPKTGLQVSYVVGATRSRVFCDDLGQVGTHPYSDMAFLFSPHTSGRQLDKFAGLHPELSALAACHPNGGDVPLANAPGEHLDIVRKARETVSLSPRSTGKAAPVTQQSIVL